MIVVVLQVVLTFTRWGLYTVAIGSNKLGAAEAGVKVKLVTIRNFVLCALTARLRRHLRGGPLAARSSRTRRAPTKSCCSRSPPAVIGGTLLAGGSGTVVGALIGALFLGILKDGLILQGVNANYLLFYTGLAIIVAMTANVYVAARAQGARRVADAPTPETRVVGPTSAPDDVLRVEHIAKRFGPVTALRDVNLHLARARCWACSATTARASRR